VGAELAVRHGEIDNLQAATHNDGNGSVFAEPSLDFSRTLGVVPLRTRRGEAGEVIGCDEFEEGVPEVMNCSARLGYLSK
jgi:hypothetical protein